MKTSTFTWQVLLRVWLYALCGAELYMMLLAQVLGGVWFPPVFGFLEVTEPVLAASFFTALITVYRFDYAPVRRRRTMIGFGFGCVLMIIANINYRLALFAPGPYMGYLYVVVGVFGAISLFIMFITYRRMVAHYLQRRAQEVSL